MKKIRLTVAQALVKFLDNQYVEFDGVETKFVKGIFTIFGHGNVVGLGQALEEDHGDLIVHQGRNEQGMSHAAIGFAKQKLEKTNICVYFISWAWCCQYGDSSCYSKCKQNTCTIPSRRCICYKAA